MSKTPEEMAIEWLNEEFGDTSSWTYMGQEMVLDAFMAGYRVGFEIGCMKGSMAMQSTLDSDCHLTPQTDHQKLATKLIKREFTDE